MFTGIEHFRNYIHAMVIIIGIMKLHDIDKKLSFLEKKIFNKKLPKL